MMKTADLTSLIDILYSSPYGLIVVDPTGDLFYMNPKAEELILTAGPVDVRTVLNLCEISGWDEILSSEKPVTKTLNINHTVYGVNIFSVPYHRTGAKYIAITLVDLDYVYTAEFTNRIKRVNLELESIIELSYDGIILSDPEGRIYKVSNSMERLSGGIKNSELIGKTAQELEQEGIILSQTRKILGRNPLMLTQKIRTGVELFLTTTRVFDENGQVIFHVVNLRNMDELNHLKKQVEEAKDLSQRYFIELQELRDKVMETDNIIVKSPAMKQVMDALMKVSRTDATVLITGESGVGKEIASKSIHKMSSRKEGPFVEINCGAIPENLLESELFGYNKGAFTGASQSGKIGFMEVANNGTLFLDEIAELPLNLQVKLLRALQEHKIYRLGGNTPIDLNVRIIAATNQNLEVLTQRGFFRKDLYYRLNVLPLHIPALRERKEDIIPITYHFLSRFNAKYQTDKFLSPEVCNILEEYDWPGNVRELENLIERLVITCEERTITRDYLPASLTLKTKPQEIQFKEAVSLKEAHNRFEHDFLKKAFSYYKDKKSMARALEIDYSTMYRKLKKHDLL